MPTAPVDYREAKRAAREQNMERRTTRGREAVTIAQEGVNDNSEEDTSGSPTGRSAPVSNRRRGLPRPLTLSPISSIRVRKLAAGSFDCGPGPLASARGRLAACTGASLMAKDMLAGLCLRCYLKGARVRMPLGRQTQQVGVRGSKNVSEPGPASSQATTDQCRDGNGIAGAVLHFLLSAAVQERLRKRRGRGKGTLGEATFRRPSTHTRHRCLVGFDVVRLAIGTRRLGRFVSHTSDISLFTIA